MTHLPPSPRQTLDRSLSEAQWMRCITDLCDLLRLPYYHVRQPQQDRAGWPDLFVADVRHGVAYAWELKTMRGRIRPAQQIWLDTLAECTRLESGVMRPSDWQRVLGLLRGDN